MVVKGTVGSGHEGRSTVMIVHLITHRKTRGASIRGGGVGGTAQDPASIRRPRRAEQRGSLLASGSYTSQNNSLQPTALLQGRGEMLCVEHSSSGWHLVYAMGHNYFLLDDIVLSH